MAESRYEIVSSIAALSESIREKVGELKNIDRDSDPDDAQGEGRGYYRHEWQALSTL